MQILLLRHGIAEDASASISDAERRLTTEGRRKLRDVLTAIAQAGIRADAIVTSPLRRAFETAEIARRCLKAKCELELSSSLEPSRSPEEVWHEVRAHSEVESLLLVGHNPLFSDAAAFLLGCGDLQLDFKKGAVMCIEVDASRSRPRGVLRWYLTARLAGSCE